MTYMYILECADGTYYTGSTKHLKVRIRQHNEGMGANYTSKRLPVKLVHIEPFTLVSEAFEREKQVQNWSHAKKRALVNGEYDELRQKAKKVFRNKSTRQPSETQIL